MFGFLLAVAMNVQCAANSAADPFVRDLAHADEVIREIHPDPFTNIGESDWQVSLAETTRELCEADSDAERVTLLMSQIARLGDGHTLVLPTDQQAFETWIPVRFYAFEEGVFVTAARGDYAHLIGGRLVSIDTIPADEALSRVMALSPHENRFHQMEMAAPHLSNMGILTGLGLIQSLDEVRIQVENTEGMVSTITIPSYHSWYSPNFRFWGEMFGPPVDPYEGYVTAFGNLAPLDFRSGDPTRPAYIRDRSPYWAALTSDASTLFIQLNTQMDSPSLPFPEFRDRVNELLERDFERLVVDLRFNFGGDGSMLLPLVHDIIRSDYVRLNRPVIVLTGRQTFSSGMMMAGLLDRHTNAVSVGEAMGARLNGYGDARTYSLPNTGLSLSVSTLFWQMGRPDIDDVVTAVDFPVPFRADDYFSGRDASLELILGYEDLRTLPQVFLEDGADAGNALLESRRAAFGTTGYWRAFPSDPDEMERAVESLQSERQDDARLLVEHWANLSPRSIRAQERWVSMLVEEGQCDDIEDASTNLRQLDPHHPLLNPNLVEECGTG